jgi:tetratricopeptide (TPR) repeat protein
MKSRVTFLVVVSCLMLPASLRAAAQVPGDPGAWELKARSLCGAHLWPTDRKVKELRELCEATLASNPGPELRALAERYLGEAYMWKEGDPASPADAARAIAQFGRVIELFPESEQAAWARFGIGEVYRANRKFDEALAAYADVLKRQVPDALRPWVALREANALANKKDDPDPVVADKYRAVTTSYPGTDVAARALVYLANYLSAMQRFDDAAAQYEKLLKDYGQIALRVELPKAHAELANIATWSGDRAAATRHWQAIIEEFPDTRLTVDAFYHIARAYTQLADTPKEAIAVLEPHAASGPPVKQAAALLVLEILYRESGLTEKAAAARERLQAEFPASRLVDDLALEVQELATKYTWFKARDSKTYSEAAVLAENGLLLNAGPGWQWRSKFQAGKNRCLAGDHAVALGWYQDIRKNHPDCEEMGMVVEGAAQCETHLGHLDAAVSLLEQAAQLEERPKERGIYLMQAADICLKQGLYQRGISLLDRLEGDAAQLAVSPRARASAHLLRGQILLKKGDQEAGLGVLRRAILEEPDTVEAGGAGVAIAKWYYDKGDYARAAEECMALADLGAVPAWWRARALTIAGQAFRKLGDFQAALAAYGRVSAIAPGSNLVGVARADTSMATEEMNAALQTR